MALENRPGQRSRTGLEAEQQRRRRFTCKVKKLLNHQLLRKTVIQLKFDLAAGWNAARRWSWSPKEKRDHRLDGARSAPRRFSQSQARHHGRPNAFGLLE